MLIAVICFAFIPLVVDLGGGADKPFLFNVGFRCGLLSGWLVFLLFNYYNLLFRREVWTAIRRLLKEEFHILSKLDFRNLTIIWVLIGQFQLGLFALSVQFVDISIMAILYETWPIFMILLTARIFRDTQRYQPVNLELLAFLVIGFSGIFFVVISQEDELRGILAISETDWRVLLVGTILVFLTVLLASLSSYSFKWGSDLGDLLPRGVLGSRSNASVQLFGVIMASFLASLLSTPILFVSGVINGENIATGDFFIAFFGGIGTLAIGNIL